MTQVCLKDYLRSVYRIASHKKSKGRNLMPIILNGTGINEASYRHDQ